ncbi:MAG: iron-siderophore ABC transporter substrate-binding protein [Ketobacter sp.]|nr:iron-siderophore ABC transporter substrate-binding protein [Ketobacter sp.]
MKSAFLWLLSATCALLGNHGLAAITLHHDAGSTTFERPPQRIVALTWSHAEILLTLGITPVGVATVSGYRKWQSNHPPLPDTTIDVGHRGNPSMEAIARLKPDLILGYNFRHQNQLGRLQGIAPTLLYRQYPSSSQPDFRYFEQMLRITRDLGRLLNRDQQAETAISDMEDTIRSARQQLQQAGLQGQPVVLGKFVGMGMGLRVFADQAMSADVAQQLGLQNHWHSALPGRDFSHIQLPQMLALGNCHLIIFGDDSNETALMEQSPIWPQLEFVVNHRYYRAPNSWGFGGPLSATLMAQRIRNALLGYAP